MPSTRYHYYEFGNKTSKLLAWQIKKETPDNCRHVILTEGGRLLDNSLSINAEFKQFYKDLYKTGQDADNIGAKRFMDGITLPKLQDEDRDLLDADISKMDILQATITLLPKPGKDKQKCDSYRLLSLLNADYKIQSKLIALTHADETGFVTNRHGADIVQRLLHILNTAQKKSKSYANDVYGSKVFDRIGPSFLFQTLEAMGFGD